jgi:hypothetical protein
MTASHDDNGVQLRDCVRVVAVVIALTVAARQMFGDLQYHVLWDVLSFMWEMERDLPLMGWQLEKTI